MIDRRRLVVYLDEVDDEPAKACETLAGLNARLVALRSAWTRPLEGLQDQALHRLKDLVDQHGLKATLIHSDVGGVAPEALPAVPGAELARPFHLANYFGARHVRLQAGVGRAAQPEPVRLWLERVTKHAVGATVTPLLGLHPASAVIEPADLAVLLRDYPRWKLAYDPAELVVTEVLDPFTRYWVLLKSATGAVVLRDAVPGQGWRPVGLGACRWSETLTDATQSGYRGLYLLAPTLGRRYGGAVSRPDTFRLAWEAISAYF